MYRLFLLFLLSTAATAQNQFNFSHVYGNSMVLQSEPHNASIWGWGAVGADTTVTVMDNNNVARLIEATTVDSEGRWRVSLPAQPASFTPVSIVAVQNGVSLALEDVLFGDVYVCSGQSNMAFSVATPNNDRDAEAKIVKAYANDPGASFAGTYVSADQAIADSINYPNLRFLVVGNKKVAPVPIQDFYPSPGNTDSNLPLAHPWQIPSPDTIGVGMDVMGGNGAGELSAVCYYYGLELLVSQKKPIGLLHSSYGGSSVEDWISAEVLGDGTTGPCIGPIVHGMGTPTNQWNAQIRPLLNTTIKGAIWYQGESNAGIDELYSCRFEQMTKLWRSQWFVGTGGATDPNFPMGIVQIGPMMNNPPENSTFEIRWGQTGGYGYVPNARWPNNFMATAFDLANPPNASCISGCIHIFNKQAVGHRLAVAARYHIYQESIVYSGPRIVSAAAGAGNILLVTFDSIGLEGKGLTLRGVSGFEVTVDGVNWVETTNLTVESANTVVITLDGTIEAAKVLQLRYANSDIYSTFYNNEPAVFNGEGLPTAPTLISISK